MKPAEHIPWARAEVKRYLRGIGFNPAATPIGSRPEVAAFIGPIVGSGWSETVKIVIYDWYFCELPRAFLTNDASPLRVKTFSHIASNGNICYQTGTTVLNAFAPANAIALCIQDVQALLYKLYQQGEAWSHGEIQREFPAYWQAAHEIYSCGIADRTKPVEMFIDADQESQVLFGRRWIYQDPILARSIIEAMGLKDPRSIGEVSILHADRPLFVGEKGAPKNSRELMAWLKMHGRTVAHLADQAMSSKDFFRRRHPYLLIVGSNASCAVRMTLNERDRESFAKRPRDFPNRCKSHVFPPLEITRLNVIDASPNFVHNRNKQPTLENKQICVVGAGSIGGYLCDALARMGAGLGGRGLLSIIDNDGLFPENLSRHRLGIDSVGKSKADALQTRLKTELPWLNIDSEASNIFARLPTLLGKYDLIINATGEEAVSRRINLYQQQSGAQHKTSPVLHCWVAGMGEGAQAMWVDASGPDACWECRWHHHEHGAIDPRFKFLNEEVQHELVGCKAVTPYAVGVSMAAAALACELVADWLKGQTSPKFRTRALSNANVQELRDKTYKRLKGCPACSTRS